MIRSDRTLGLLIRPEMQTFCTEG